MSTVQNAASSPKLNAFIERVVDGSVLGRTHSASSTLRDASSESGCSPDQKQPCPYDEGPMARDALTGRCETFDGDGCHYDSHHARVHDPDDEEDRRHVLISPKE